MEKSHREGVLDPEKVPSHVAIIMDGNRRWALEKGFSTKLGHSKGVEVLVDIVKESLLHSIKVLTVFAFSTENWQRPREEVAILLELLQIFLKEKTPLMLENGVKVTSIGNIAGFPPAVQSAIQAAKEATKECDKLSLVLALNYGGRDDLKRAVVKIAEGYKEGAFTKEEVTESLIAEFLDTAPFGDPDLLIRTSGEMRVSNFLLWQISYTEVYLTETLWPEFSRKHFFEALLAYQGRKRRLGI